MKKSELLRILIKNKGQLAELRNTTNLDQRDFAREVGLSIYTVAAHEQGKRNISDRKGTMEKYISFFSKRLSLGILVYILDRTR